MYDHEKVNLQNFSTKKSQLEVMYLLYFLRIFYTKKSKKLNKKP